MQMDRDRWARVEELLHRALAARGQARMAVLEEAAATGAGLREEVEALIRAHEADVPVLDGGPEALVPMLDADDEPITNRRIGPYRVLRELGHGGMGVVYLAERDDADLRQLVAIKCLLPGMATRELHDRFRRERRILASLTHPNIARLYDGGVTDAGEPYFVMEYVDGEPIGRYSDANRLTVERRLDLFATVCEAVQYAHQRLVVHRDIKPANILVTADGRIHLLDFGIARLLQDDDAMAATTRLMTPEYASPEQIAGDPVTAASDVYSLGLILFELLTGSRPFAREAGGSPSLRSKLTTDAVRASVAATTGPDPGTGLRVASTVERAAARSSTPERLRRRLRGDLDAIIEKSLETDAAARYASAQALLDDIRSHIAGLPVNARIAGRSYRIRKFARRHRFSIGAMAAVLLALVTGLAVALWQGSIAARERDLAMAEAAKAEKVTDFLVGIFESADPGGSRGENLTARQILDRGSTRIEAELASQPAVRATVRRAIGLIYSNLALFDEADRLIRRSLTDHIAASGPDDAEVADDREALAVNAASAGRADADSLFTEALTARMRLYPPDHPKVADALSGLAVVRLNRDPESADTLLARAISILRNAPDELPTLAVAVNNLGLLRHGQGEYDEAERLYHEAVELHRRAHGDDHPQTLVTLSNLGALLQLRGRLVEADSLTREVLATRRRVFGDHHPDVAATLASMGQISYALGRYDDAERYYLESLSIRRDFFPDDHGSIGASYQSLANVYAASGRISEARIAYAAAVDRIRQGAGQNSLVTGRILNDRAGFYERLGDFVAATAGYRDAWQIYRERLGEAHAFTALVEGNIGSELLLRDSLPAARAHLEHALAVLEKAYSPEHPSLGPILIGIGSIQLREGNAEAADTTLRRALAIVERSLPSGHWRIAQARIRLGRTETVLRRYDEAESLLSAARSSLEQVRDRNPRDWFETLLGLEELYSSTDRLDEAAKYRALRESVQREGGLRPSRG
jgi:eukaryotic-like serine/threonine-protein kinase